MKIINLGKVNPVYVTVGPGFQIAGKDVDIKFNGTEFTCECGCLHSFKVSNKNIDRIIFETNGGKNAETDVLIVVPKNYHQNSIDGINKEDLDDNDFLLEETEHVLITKKLYARSKSDFKSATIKMIPKNQYAEIISRVVKIKGVNQTQYSHEFMHREISAKDQENIMFLLQRMKEYLPKPKAIKA